MNRCRTLFITAIDTDAGKTVATGLLARTLLQAGYVTGTMKPVQTGCTGIAEDIVTHRRICGLELQPEDLSGLTAPEILPVPAAPALAAAMAGRTLDTAGIDRALTRLQQQYELLLVEGAGGLFVPLTHPPQKDAEMMIDWAAGHRFPTILVTSGRLGGINHTLLSLEALQTRKMPVRGLLYNRWPDTAPELHCFAMEQFRRALRRYGFPEVIIEVPILNGTGQHLQGAEALLADR